MIPGTSRSSIGAMASGVRSRGERPVPPVVSIRSTPSSAQALLLLINQFYKIGQKAFLRLFYRDQWFLLYRFQHEELADNFPEFTQLLPPKGIQFWADPHVIYAGGKHYIFLEELPIGSDKAHISVLTIDRSGHFSR